MATNGETHVVTSSRLLDDWATDTVYVLVGLRYGNANAVHFCVLDSFPCEDPDVIEEQVDCIRCVLPAAMSVLGFGHVGEINAKLADGLSGCLFGHRSTQPDGVFIIKRNGSLTAQLWPNTTASHLSVTSERIDIEWDAKLTFLKRASSNPFLVEYRDEHDHPHSFLLDSKSTATVASVVGANRMHSCEMVQLGTSSDSGKPWVRVPVALCPRLFSGQHLLSAVQAFTQPDTFTQRGYVVVQVKSGRPSELVYACRVPREEEPNSLTLTEREWTALRGAIEDATGDTVTISQLIGVEVEQSKAPTDSHRQEAVSASATSSAKTQQLSISLAVVAVAVILGALLLAAGARSR